MVALVAVVAGCSSMEDRIENVVSHELEQCQNSEDDFYTVNALDGDYDILTDACESELGEVEMDTDYRGTVESGPLVWTAREEGQAVTVTRVGWYALDRALELADRSDPEIEQLEEAAELFARAQDELEDSVWVRQRRLKNLVELQAATMDAGDEDVAGEAVREYLDEFTGWAESNDEPEAAARARLTVISHLTDHIETQQESIERFGAGDERLRAAAQHAEDDGDMEEAREIRADLEQRIEERPERKAILEDRIEHAQRQKCVLTEDLHVEGVEDSAMRTQISSLVGDRDCDFDDADDADDDDASNGDD